MLLSLGNHVRDLAVRKAARRLDVDGLLLVRGLVLGGHVHDAVRVDVERHLFGDQDVRV